jgi:peptide/nickel transport system substrate-binding protein
MAAPTLKSIEAKNQDVIFHLDRPDPYLATNVTLWRYFTTGDPSKPCHEPSPGDTIVTSGDYRLPRFKFSDLNPEQSLKLLPIQADRPTLLFTWAYDDNTKALELIRGDIDVLPNSISLSKTRWLEKSYGDRFQVLGRSNGVNVSYLLFNFRNHYLKNFSVRKAIALSIDRDDFVKNKLFGLGTVANSLLSPLLPESSPQQFEYNPARAEKLLDEAGFKRGADGIRFTLRFKTTSVRDGFETALALQHWMRRIGIEVVLDVVEPAVFFASIRKGAFDLYASRWIGVSDASLFQRVVKTGDPNNRGHYSSPLVDRLLDQALAATNDTRRRAIYSKIQAKIAKDLPFVPLWYWDPTVVLRKDLQGLNASDLSLSGSLAPLARLR